MTVHDNMKSGKIKSLFTNLFLMFVAVMIMLMFIEIIIRIFYPQNLNYTEFDNILMYKHIPDSKVTYSRQEFSNEIKFNSNGLRDYEYDYKKPKNVYRILLLGSSFSQALQVPLEHTYENVLERKLNGNLAGKYEVINTAVGGWGTAQELFYLKTEGIRYEPDLILLDFSMRDVRENAINSLVTVTNGKLVEHIPIRASWPKRAMLFCSRYSHLCSLTQTVILGDAEKKGFISSLLSKLRITSSADDRSIKTTDLFSKNNTPNVDAAFEETFLLIKEIKKVADENKIALVMFIIPHREQVDALKWNEFINRYNANEKQFEYDKVQKLALKFAKQNNIQVFDMLPYFRQKNANNTFYYEIDGHWNEQGHEMTAGLLYNYLLSNKLVK